LAGVFIKTEADLYRNAAQQPGGWEGKREFKVQSMKEEATDITSLVLVPADGKEACSFQPGQYIAVCENPSDESALAPRHYNLTSQPGQPFRITVKRRGLVSGFLHDCKNGDSVHLTTPFGPAYSFLEEKNKERPLIFISQGIGTAATISVLTPALAARDKVFVVHVDSSPESHAFREETKALLAESNHEYRYFYSQSTSEAKDSRTCSLLDILTLECFSADTEDDPNVRTAFTTAGFLDELKSASVDVKSSDIVLCVSDDLNAIIKPELEAAQATVSNMVFGHFHTGLPAATQSD
jgi:nitric oxide dioxygenase